MVYRADFDLFLAIIYRSLSNPPQDYFFENFMIATSTCIIQDSTTTICQTDYGFLASTTPTIYNGFTAGEIIITLFLFWIFVFLIFNFMVAKFLRFFHKK